MLQQHQQFQNEMEKEELIIQYCDEQLRVYAERKLQQQQQNHQDNEKERNTTNDSTHNDTSDDMDDETDDVTDVETNKDIKIQRGNRRKQRKVVSRRRSKRIRHKNGDYAMTMDIVKAHLIERGIITQEQADLPNFSIRFTEKSDWSATTKKELQQQVLHLCRYGLLASWVLQDNGSRKLEIVRCSGVEGHHRDTPSSWVNENSSPFTRNHQLYNKGKLFVEIHSNCIIHGLVIIVLTE